MDFFSPAKQASYAISESAKLKATKHFLNSSKLTHFVLLSAASQQTNAVSANSPVTDKFQRKMMKFAGAFLFRGIRRFRKICCLLLFLLLLSSTRMQLIRCAFDKRECQQQVFMAERFFWKASSSNAFPYSRPPSPTFACACHWCYYPRGVQLSVSKNSSKNSFFKAAVAQPFTRCGYWTA